MITIPPCLIPTRRETIDPVEAGALKPGDVIAALDGSPFEIHAVVDHGSYVHLVGHLPDTDGYLDILKGHVFDRLGCLPVLVLRC